MQSPRPPAAKPGSQTGDRALVACIRAHSPGDGDCGLHPRRRVATALSRGTNAFSRPRLRGRVRAEIVRRSSGAAVSPIAASAGSPSGWRPVEARRRSRRSGCNADRAASCAAATSTGSARETIVKRESDSRSPWKSSSNAPTRVAAAASSSSPVRVLRHSAEGTSTRASAETTSASSARIALYPVSSAYSLTSADESAKVLSDGPL